MKFEWDTAKSRSNRSKHGITFEEAATIFADPFLLQFLDAEHSEDEERIQSIGMSEKLRVLMVVSTEREANVIRIISARKATRKEVELYEENQI